MNLDELRTVQSKERSKDSLQHLRESFYADVAEYVAGLRDKREQAAADTDNPLDDPEVNRLTDEIHTAEDVVEAIYERRVGKVVKRASLAAAGMPADEEGLTTEEQELFAELVGTIETNKESVLNILAGEETGGPGAPPAATGDSSRSTATASGASEPGEAPTSSEAAGGPGPEGETAGDVSAADVMGGDPPGVTASSRGEGADGSTSADSSSATDDGSRPATAEAAAVADAAGDSASGGGIDASGGASDVDDGATPPTDASDSDSDSDSTDPLDALDERTTVRLTSDVGEIFGVDERTYDLANEDVVTLPEANAEPLVERGAAEKLE